MLAVGKMLAQENKDQKAKFCFTKTIDKFDSVPNFLSIWRFKTKTSFTWPIISFLSKGISHCISVVVGCKPFIHLFGNLSISLLLWGLLLIQMLAS